VKAAVFKGLGQPLVIETVPDPQPSAHEVVVRVGRCGICGSDLHMTHEPAFGLPAGAIIGHEFAGEVVALGSRASSMKVGDLVAVAPLRGCGECSTCLQGEPAWCKQMVLQGGGYAEYAAATERQCRRLPASTSIEDGALVEPLAVALHGVSLAKIVPGSKVLVMGAGPIGLAVAYWARRLGATKIAVSDLHSYQSDLAHRVGATAFVTVQEDMVAKVNGVLGGEPDIVFECVGRPGILSQALEHVRVHGKIVILGLCTALDSFVPFRAVSKEVTFIASAFFKMHEYEAALDALDGGHSEARSLITNTVPLETMPAAFEALRERTSQCKVMVRPW
jgi:(R,R)-butanediol dehydrogenase/meso-butanediol dehydrogenase/diacetyl reductase